MRKHHVLIVVILAVCIGTIISSTFSVNQYADFSKASEHEDRTFTIVGNLNKSKPVDYNPRIDPNIVSFYLVDKKGMEFQVILNQSKPQDFESSEDVVVKGRCKDNIFYANTILLKCPSKYKEENIFANP